MLLQKGCVGIKLRVFQHHVNNLDKARHMKEFCGGNKQLQQTSELGYKWTELKVLFQKIMNDLTHLIFNPQRFAQTENIFFAFFSDVNMLKDTRVNLPCHSQMITALRRRNRYN